VKEICMAVRRALEDSDEAALERVREHMETCASCRAHAALLETLTTLRPPEADDGRVRAILRSLPVARWQRRRLVTWLPAAAGLLLVVAGMMLLGGVPAGGAVAALPSAIGALGGLLGRAVVGTLTVLRGSGDAVRAVVSAGGVWVVVWLLLAALGGGWGVMALARGRRREE
jgi:hypothetical protein